MHEHVTCKLKYIMGSTQSKPNSTHSFNIYISHIYNAWKYSYNTNVMQCMNIYDHLNITQPKNFTKTSSILKNPKSLVRMQEMHDEWMKKRHTRGRKCSLRPKNTWVRGLECEREVWEDEKTKTIERDWGEMKKIRADPI